MKKVIMILLLLATAFWAEGATEEGAVIFPYNQKQLITDWGYDIKQGGKAEGLSTGFAQKIFIEDRMTLLRVPIWARNGHPAAGQVVTAEYESVIAAINNARSVRSDLRLFASLKLEGPDTFPSWVADANGVLPLPYARLLVDFLVFMKNRGIEFDVLGVDNEMEFNGGNITPAKHKKIVDELKSLAGSFGLTVPKIIGPETYGPKGAWVSDLINLGGGNTLDLVGTHYYPLSRPLAKLKELCSAAGSRPVWNSEVHWKNEDSTNDIEEGEDCLFTIFDGFDLGMTGMSWWAYVRTGVKGELEKNISKTTVGTRPVVMDDIDGPDVVKGKIVTRAYRQNNTIHIWVINNANSSYNNFPFTLARGKISGAVTFRRWDASQGTNGQAIINGEKSFFMDILPRSISLISCELESSFFLKNRSSGHIIKPQAGSENAPIIQVTENNNSARWEAIPSDPGFFHLKNIETGMYFRPADDTDHSTVIQKPASFNGPWTQWQIVEADNGYAYLKNRQTGRYLRIRSTESSPSGSSYELEAADPSNTGGWTQWQFLFKENDTTSGKGDVNGDGKISIVDALMTAQYSVGLNPPGFLINAGDVNCDGIINILDALMIARITVGSTQDFCG